MAKKSTPRPPESVSRRSQRPANEEGGDARRRLLDATLELVAEHGPDGFSSRDVARHAGLTYGLIHYHFGSHQELLRASIRDLVERYAEVTPEIDATEWIPMIIPDRMVKRDRRALMQVVLHWDEYGDMFGDFPVTRRRLEALREGYGDDIALPYLKAAAIVSGCLRFGWSAAYDWYTTATQASAHDREVLDAVVTAVEASIITTALTMSNEAGTPVRTKRGGPAKRT